MNKANGGVSLYLYTFNVVLRKSTTVFRRANVILDITRITRKKYIVMLFALYYLYHLELSSSALTGSRNRLVLSVFSVAMMLISKQCFSGPIEYRTFHIHTRKHTVHNYHYKKNNKTNHNDLSPEIYY